MVPSIEEQVRNHEIKLAEAIRTINLTVLDELLHDNLLFLNQNGQMFTKAADLEIYRSGKLAILEIIPSEQKMSVVGETVITFQNMWPKGNYEQQLFTGQFRYLRVWKFSGEHWQVIAGACSLI